MRKLYVFIVIWVLLFTSSALAEDYPCVGIPTKSKVNIRIAPSIKSDITGEVSSDMELTVLGEEKDNEGLVWYKIQLDNGKEAYISSNFIALKNEAGAEVSSSTANQTNSFPVDPFTLLQTKGSSNNFNSTSSGLDIKNLFQDLGFSVQTSTSSMPLWPDGYTDKKTGHTITCEYTDSNSKSAISFLGTSLDNIIFYCTYDFSDGEIQSSWATGQAKTGLGRSKLYSAHMTASDSVTKQDYISLKDQLTSLFKEPEETSKTITSTATIGSVSKKITYNQTVTTWNSIWCYPNPVAIKIVANATKDNKFLSDGLQITICYLGNESTLRTYGN